MPFFILKVHCCCCVENGLDDGMSSREISSWKIIAVIQVRGDGIFKQSDGGGDGEQQTDYDTFWS